jgi:hypothetical protein
MFRSLPSGRLWAQRRSIFGFVRPHHAGVTRQVYPQVEQHNVI